MHRQNAPDKRNIYAESLRTHPAFLHTFFCHFPAVIREFIGRYTGGMWENHGYSSDEARIPYGRSQNTGRRRSDTDALNLRKAKPAPCLSPPSPTLPSAPIRLCPAYTSVKVPQSGVLAKYMRQYSGTSANIDRHGMRWACVRTCSETATELEASSEPAPTGLVLAAPVPVQFKSSRSAVQVRSELRSRHRKNLLCADLCAGPRPPRAGPRIWGIGAFAFFCNKYRNASLTEFVAAEIGRWQGIEVRSTICIPDSLTITASVSYQMPVDEIYAHIRQAGAIFHERDGMISFCGPEFDPGDMPGPEKLPAPRERAEPLEWLHGRWLLALR
ncbi:hypothetical protein JHJ32_05925 [Parapedobacter sp. ISTM3]|uniref:hypothetical protein n=1 Tax=Parapedobacter sp. ISTM3 TaxID=2800130 RepID=UPI001903EAC1|nr:hypothetical protein [Parapedobacter sp. ISTM3]MBK1439514.1 hypothetical protein [Parapedobacter sp. ISTM3]